MFGAHNILFGKLETPRKGQASVPMRDSVDGFPGEKRHYPRLHVQPLHKFYHTTPRRYAKAMGRHGLAITFTLEGILSNETGGCLHLTETGFCAACAPIV